MDMSKMDWTSEEIPDKLRNKVFAIICTSAILGKSKLEMNEEIGREVEKYPEVIEKIK
jgi:hypothetical protein